MTRRIPTAVAFLDAVAGRSLADRTSSADRPIRLATVDPDYPAGDGWPDAGPPARVVFDGETEPSGKAYPVASGFIPRPGQRVWMVPIGTTYLIAGAVGSVTAQGFWQDPDGLDSGTELGGGSYFDTLDGLYVDHDLTVTGAVSGAVARGLIRGQAFTGALATSGTTEKIMDYFTEWVPEAGRRYELRWMLVGQGSVAGDAYRVRFRYQATSGALTSSGTAFMELDQNGVGFAIPYHWSWPIPTLTSGATYAIGATVTRASGTGVFSANTAITGRRLEIHDVGSL